MSEIFFSTVPFPGLSNDEVMLEPTFSVGDPVWTYARRGTSTPEPILGFVMHSFTMEGHYPPVKYVVQHNGVLCLRDSYTMAKKLDDVKVKMLAEASDLRAREALKEYTYDD